MLARNEKGKTGGEENTSKKSYAQPVLHKEAVSANLPV